jgi:predicted MFS family arabinose efflux permease
MRIPSWLREDTDVLILSAMGLFMAASANVVNSVLALYLRQDVQAPLELVGPIVAAAFITSLVVRIPVSLSISIERALGALLMSSLALAVLPFLYASTSSILALVGLRLIHGAAFTIYGLTTLTLTSIFSTHHSGMSVSIAHYTAGIALGLLLGPLLGTFTVETLGIRATLMVASLVSLPMIPLTVWLRRRHPDQPHVPARRLHLRDLVAVARDVRVQTTFTLYLAYTILYGILLSYAPIYAGEAYGYTNTEVVALFFGYFAATAVIRLYVHRIIAHIRIIGAFALGLASTLVAALTIAFAPGREAFAAGFLVMSVAQGILFPSAAIVIAASITMAYRLMANALYMNAWDLGVIIGPTMAALLLGRLSLPQIFALTATLPLLALLGLLYIHLRGGEWKEAFYRTG